MSVDPQAGARAKSVGVIGGGLAGLAAGCALGAAGFRVTLLERKPYVGGRASSYEHPTTGETVDNCQHVLLGCCTNLIDFYRRIGAEDKIRWYDRLTFLEPGGGRSTITASFLPEPLHTAPSFLASTMLSWGDKLAVARALLKMIPRLPVNDGQSFLEWLRAHRQTERAIERFWKTVLVSALNEDLDRVSVSAAALVFRESFLKSARGGLMGVPRVPLTELYGKAGDYIRARGGEIILRTPVDSVCLDAPGGASGGLQTAPPISLMANGQQLAFDYVISAVPFDVLSRLLPDHPAATPLREALASFQTSPITGVHLWFDRQITKLDHAVLLDRTIQWMFHKSRLLDRFLEQPRAAVEGASAQAPEFFGSYIELVISASKSLVQKSRQEIIDLALRELAEFFPTVKEAKVIKATVIKEVHATFSPLPGSDEYRPSPVTPWSNLFIAGDWTATGWPATMEGAVRSGYLAAEALCRSNGSAVRFAVPDLPLSGLMRLLGG